MHEDQLRIRERAIEASSHGVAILDITKPGLPIIYINKAFERITGYPEEQILGQNLAFLHASKTQHVNHKRIILAIKELREETVELESYQQDGKAFWCEISVAPVKDPFDLIRHYVCLITDVTERHAMEEQLIKQATHDSLTELPNRVLLIDRVDQAILQAKKKGSLLAFLFLDLDHFKMTNDTLGHNIGDRLLQAVSNRLLLATNDFDTVCRLGGDEFVILLHDLYSEQQAQQTAEKILASLAKPVQIDEHNLEITGSIGISYFPKDGADYESLMKSADLSMYHAKDSGRNTYRNYDKEMNTQIVNRMQITTALRESLKKNEFYLLYQPLINLSENKVVGFEALLRWNSHLLGAVLPNDFIGIAEENGFIVEIGLWAIEEACHQLMRWHQQGYNYLTIAVNISGRQLRQPRMAEKIRDILVKTGLSPTFLELELTESLLVDNIKHAVDVMYELKDMGIKVVIDDFGTGYSSLAYLKQFPVDKLKIDRSFITELVDKKSDAAIARAIINLAHSLNLEVVAEGVETELQRQFITTHDCDYAQGYYFSPPQKAEQLNKLLTHFF